MEMVELKEFEQGGVFQHIDVLSACVSAKTRLIDPTTEATWISGVAEICQIFVPNGATTITVEVGCWSDTDDDCQEWTSDLEGERVLYAIMEAESVIAEKILPSLRRLLPTECESIGLKICKALRADAQRDDED